MANILDDILAVKRDEVRLARQRVPLEDLRRQALVMPRCRNFYRTITRRNPRGINVIAEVKHASPSAGLIREDFDHLAIARDYHRAGADALSVLTDEKFFQGSLQYLTEIAQNVPLPVLRKDFIIDPYQIYEARVAGADAVLLIAEALNPGQLTDLLILAHQLTLTVLLEVHELDHLLRVRSMMGFPQARYTLLGINNRDLTTMQVDLGTSLRLADFIENKRELVSESGIRTTADVQRLINAGFAGVLVGETLMRQPDVATAFAELLGQPKPQGE
jgi:indole-3-glycerol phosphate synthase